MRSSPPTSFTYILFITQPGVTILNSNPLHSDFAREILVQRVSQPGHSRFMLYRVRKTQVIVVPVICFNEFTNMERKNGFKPKYELTYLRRFLAHIYSIKCFRSLLYFANRFLLLSTRVFSSSYCCIMKAEVPSCS